VGAEGVTPGVEHRCGAGGADGVDCDEAIHELYHYLDGELTDERRTEITVHLDKCGHCAGAADFEAELRTVIASRCRDRVPDSLLDRIAGAIHEESRRHSPDGGPSSGDTASGVAPGH
jgi:mycothiol system anti-sigma-R factor